MSYRETIAELDALSRRRALTSEESDRLDRAIWHERKCSHCAPRAPRWAPEEDRCAIDLRLRGTTYGSIAKQVSRTKDAVAARLNYLGYRGVSSI